jgi:hypothetical protein
VVNTKAIYAAAGGIAAAAIAILFVIGLENFNNSTSNNNPNGQNAQNLPTATVQNQTNAQLQLTLKNIIVNKTDDKDASVQVIFNATNPSKNTITLETIHYTVYVGQFKMTSGDIGQSPEGFVGNQADVFPIVEESTVTLKDKQVAVRNDLTANNWDNMVLGTARYRVEGAYSYTSTGSNFQTSYGEKDFNMTFP